MPWIKVDDHFDEHPKLAAVGPVGWGVWMAGLAYCNRNLTDGFIPYAIAEGIGGAWLVRMVEDFTDDAGRESTGEQVWHIARTSGMDGEDMDSEWVIQLLVSNGLWSEVRGGYRVHDYDDYQPTKAVVLAERAKKAAAGRAGGVATATARATAPAEADAKAPAQAKLKPVPVPVPLENDPLTPAKRGNGLSPRSQGTNPRAVAAASEKALRDQLQEITWRYRRGEISEDQEQAERDAILRRSLP